MLPKRYFFVFVILVTVNSGLGLSQAYFFSEENVAYCDKIYDTTIASVRFGLEGTPFSYPIMQLNGGTPLQLKFDQLSPMINNFAYSVIHCDMDWKPSDISPYDYIEGYYEYRIEDYYSSMVAFEKYSQYRVSIPNDELVLKLSGNYLLVVYDEENPERIILTRRFMVVDEQIGITTTLRRPNSADNYDAGQEISFSLQTGSFYIPDVYSDIKIRVMQNYNWYISKEFSTPRFVRDGELEYDFGFDNVFRGLKEYRYFDTRSIRYNSVKVQRIEYRNPYHHVFLLPDEIRSYKPYMFNEDFNGRYYVEILEFDDNDLNPDYTWAHFNLNYNLYDPDAEIYLFGEISNWSFDEKYRMKYDFESQTFRNKLYLKQGYYNYWYVYKEKGKDYDFEYLEGSSYETENDYLIFVYFRDPTERYDQLIANQIVNTVKYK